MPRKYGLSFAELNALQEVQLKVAVMLDLILYFKRTDIEWGGGLHGYVNNHRIVVERWTLYEDPAPCQEEILLDLEPLLSLPLLPGGRLVGIVHSHPFGPPVPSCVDEYFMEQSPFVWLIVGAQSREVEPTIAAFAGGSLVARSLLILTEA